MPPRYPFPLELLPGLAAAILLGQSRSFRSDARRAAGRLQPRQVVIGEALIPASGPYLVTINHFNRPGFSAWWLALAVSAALPAAVVWVITSYWRFEAHPWRAWLRPLSGWLLTRVARVYGFISMPALPPDPQETAARAAAVRRILALSQSDLKPVIGFAPEGRDASQPGLTLPLPGVGRLIEHLVRQGYLILPVGVYEQEGLVIRIGEAYTPRMSGSGPTANRDLALRQEVMQRIAALLPESLYGEFGITQPTVIDE